MRHSLLTLVLLVICYVGAFAQSDSVRVTIRTSNGYHITLDGSSKSTNVLRIWTRYGKHKVRISDDMGYNDEWDIDVNPDSGTEFNFPLEGTAHVSSRIPATVWVDGELVGDAPQDLKILGRHRLTIDAGKNYRMDKREMFFNPLDEISIDAELKKAPAKLYGFILANYMTSANAPGIMMGLGKRFGGYIKGNISMKDEGVDFDTEQIKYPTDNLEPGSYEKINYFQGFSFGLTYRATPNLWAYAGAGSGIYAGAKVSMQYNSSMYETVDGVLVDLGIIGKWKALLLQAGYTFFPSANEYGHHFGSFNVGIGFTIHKDKKRER